MKGKEEKRPVKAAVCFAALLLAAGFWGIAFPRYMFTADCVTVTDEAGGDVTREANENGNLYLEIGGAEPEQIEIRISVLEWAKR